MLHGTPLEPCSKCFGLGFAIRIEERFLADAHDAITETFT